MKYILAILFLASHVSFSQINLPELSPEARLIESVGYTTFEIRYGRPAARGRKIFGELVPANKLWRTGAGRCSVISFDQPVVIGGKTVSAGAYALLTIPNDREWTVLLSSDTSKHYGDPAEYDSKTEVVAFKATRVTADFHESLTMSIDIMKYDATVIVNWEKTQVSFPIKTLSYERAKAEISKSINASPNDPERLSQAAWFYYMNNDDPVQILAWVDRALAGGDERWLLRQRFDILERMKKYDEAGKAADHAIAFLTTTKPVEWEESVKGYRERMKGWGKR